MHGKTRLLDHGLTGYFMCGIAGVIGLNETVNLGATIERMKAAIRHRGPDDHGTFLDTASGVALGHQRLSILDLQGGRQPFSSADGQIILVYNGEIYNYLDLRSNFMQEGYAIRSHSDTEVIVHAYQKWGLHCLQHLRGMFAFALWDKAKKILFCARDRLGIKPFYYFFDHHQFVFSSEIKGILASKKVPAELNSTGLEDYLTFQCCLGQETLFKNIRKIEPGYFLTVAHQGSLLKLAQKQYWDIDYTEQDMDAEHDYIHRLSSLLEESVGLHLQADVPVGAHLSGGLDSSALVCLASYQLKEKNHLKTFTGIFPDGKEYDESDYAREVARHAGSEHYEISISNINLAEILPELIYFMDEPAAGPGLIPQYMVSKFAATHVKVVLAGQGGDELFLGYARYVMAYLENCLSGAVSGKVLSPGMSLSAIAKNLVVLDHYKPMLKKFFSRHLFGEAAAGYFYLIDRKNSEDKIFFPEIYKNRDCFLRFQTIFNRSERNSLLNKMLYFDLKASLPSLLQVEDRMSMAVSLESRVPLLDHRLVEFSATIPDKIKFSAGKTKHIFRESVRNKIPERILNRKDKMGFPVPLEQWFYGKQQPAIQDILFSKKSRERGLVDISKLSKIIKNKRAISRSIWGLFCLELWFMKFID